MHCKFTPILEFVAVFKLKIMPFYFFFNLPKNKWCEFIGKFINSSLIGTGIFEVYVVIKGF